MRRKMLPSLVFLPVLCYADTSIKKTGVDRMAEQEMLLDSATIKARRRRREVGYGKSD